MKSVTIKTAIAAAAGAAILTLSACQTTPKDNAQLTSARAAVQQAEADPGVAKYAPTELNRAQQLLVNAESAFKQHGASDKEGGHYAYLAAQMAHVAEQRAQEQVAMAHVK